MEYTTAKDRYHRIFTFYTSIHKDELHVLRTCKIVKRVQSILTNIQRTLKKIKTLDSNIYLNVNSTKDSKNTKQHKGVVSKF